MREPRERLKAGDLEPYLRLEFYGGRSFWRLFEPFHWSALFLMFADLEPVSGSSLWRA